jgi:hypothetical protein
MASSSTAPKASPVGIVERDLQVSFDSRNDPNADVFILALRVSGYTLERTMEDIADNSIDAGAKTVVVHLEREGKSEEWTIYVADDGAGMDRDTLDQMMRLGSRVDHDPDVDLGAFGVGSDTATLAIAKRKHVITRGPDGMLSAIWDVDVIKEQRQFVKHLGEATDKEIAMFEMAFQRYGVDPPESGTLVLIGKGDRINRTQVPAAADAVRASYANTYRRFLEPNGEVRIMVNGELTAPTDPLMRDHPDTEILYEDDVELTFKSQDGTKVKETFGVTVAHLPDFGGYTANRRAGISIENSGFYVVRNNRQLVAGTPLGIYKRHNELARFRAELSFGGAMDDQLGVTFLKSAVELHPTQALKDKIEQTSSPYRRQSQKRSRDSRKDADVTVPHDEASKAIKSKSPLLRTPESNGSSGGSKSGTGKSGRSGKGKGGGGGTGRPILATGARFEAKDMSENDPFFVPSLDQKQVVITYNAKHPAYERLILENRENRGQLAAVDYLVYSLATAELRAVGDEHADFAERMRIDTSFNLKQLLKQ